MMPVRIDVDFVRSTRRLSLPGILMLAVGLLAAWFTFTDFRDASIDVELLSMSLSRYEGHRGSTDSGQAGEVDTRAMAVAMRQLTTPWSELLQDLETVALDSREDVALLEIAPDKNKHRVRVTGEARTLQHAIDYVAQLQGADSLWYPLLESHEVLVANRDRPVHFVVVAEWKLPE